MYRNWLHQPVLLYVQRLCVQKSDNNKANLGVYYSGKFKYWIELHINRQWIVKNSSWDQKRKKT